MVRTLSILLLLLYGLATAQDASVNLSATSVTTEEALILTAENLSPDSTYTLSLTDPSDIILRHELEPAASGDLEFETTLPEAGVWLLNFSGEGIDTSIDITVTDATGMSVVPDSDTSVPDSDTLTDETGITEDTSATDTPDATSNDATEPQSADSSDDAGLLSPALEDALSNADTETTTDDASFTTESETSDTEQATPEANALTDAAQADDSSVVSDDMAVADDEADSAEADTADVSETESAESGAALDTTTALTTTETEDAATSLNETPSDNANETPADSSVQETPVEATPENTSDTPEDATAQDDADAITGNAATEDAAVTDTNNDVTNTDDTSGNEPTTQTDSTDVSPAPETSNNTTTDTTRVPDANTELSTPYGRFVISNTGIQGNPSTGSAWQLDFPANSGDTTALVDFENALYAAHGNSVLKLNARNGTIAERWIVSGQISALQASDGQLNIFVQHLPDVSETFTLQNGQITEPVRFGSNLAIFSWLKQEALTEDAESRLAIDPTNPWLYLQLGIESLDASPTNAQAAFDEAITTASTFYDLAGIARALYNVGQKGLADKAYDAAMRDFAERGYTPRLLTDLDMHEAYNFPLRPLQTALASNDVNAASFWAPWLYYLSTPRVPETQQALKDYANLLRDNNQRDEANLWRDRANSSGRWSIAAAVENVFVLLARSGWYLAGAIVVAFVLLYVTLWFKYWIPQSVVLHARHESGRGDGFSSRLLPMRYFGFTEKLLLVILLAMVLMLLGLAFWFDRGGEVPDVLKTGTLASAEAQRVLGDFEVSGSRGAFVNGYIAQIDGELEAAAVAYEDADTFGPAVNNLGVLRGEAQLYQRALDLSPRLPEAMYNLGRQTSGFPFEREYRVGEAVLAIPDAKDFQIARAGSWDEAVVTTFSAPWRLMRATPLGMNVVLWTLLMVVFFVLVLITVVWLFIPRPRFARNAPRTWLYQVFAFLIPGTGLADEAWGILLLAPWAVFGLDAVWQLMGNSGLLGITLRLDYIILVVIYLINTVAFITEYISYQRRMKALKLKHPDQARAFGLIK